VCQLWLEAAHTNPTMITFCHILNRTIEDQSVTTASVKAALRGRHRRAKTRWHLAVTLMNNPQLQSERKHCLSNSNVQEVNKLAVAIEKLMLNSDTSLADKAISMRELLKSEQKFQTFHV
jgi:hypothetical protein